MPVRKNTKRVRHSNVRKSKGSKRRTNVKVSKRGSKRGSKKRSMNRKRVKKQRGGASFHSAFLGPCENKENKKDCKAQTVMGPNSSQVNCEWTGWPFGKCRSPPNATQVTYL